MFSDTWWEDRQGLARQPKPCRLEGGPAKAGPGLARQPGPPVSDPAGKR